MHFLITDNNLGTTPTSLDILTFIKEFRTYLITLDKLCMVKMDKL